MYPSKRREAPTAAIKRGAKRESVNYGVSPIKPIAQKSRPCRLCR